MNKKAQVFEKGLVIVVFSLCVIALISFIAYNHKIKLSISEIYPAVLVYSDDGQFYAEESGKISIYDAFYKTSKELGEKCKKSAANINYPIWTKECVMKDAAIKDRFLQHVSESMAEFGKSPKSVSLNGDNIYFLLEPFQKNYTLSKTAKIDVNYNSGISFNLSLSESNINLNFERLYNAVFERWDGCNNEADLSKVRGCLANLKISGWKFIVRNDDFFCDLISEKGYYTSYGYEPLAIKFKLEK